MFHVPMFTWASAHVCVFLCWGTESNLRSSVYVCVQTSVSFYFGLLSSSHAITKGNLINQACSRCTHIQQHTRTHTHSLSHSHPFRVRQEYARTPARPGRRHGNGKGLALHTHVGYIYAHAHTHTHTHVGYGHTHALTPYNMYTRVHVHA